MPSVPEPCAAPRLLAIVEVDKADRVRCGQPGCNHSVFKAVHVVRDEGKLMVLGSTCFGKRYGGMSALGKAQHWGGKGKPLTPEERAMLVSNTEALLALFEAQEARLREEEMEKLRRMQARAKLRKAPFAAPFSVSVPKAPVVQAPLAPIGPPRPFVRRQNLPWSWSKPASSVAAFKLRDGTGWVRVQHQDGRQFVAPWPAFDGWDEALPPAVGVPSEELGAYEVSDIVQAIAFLRARARLQKITGVWSEAVAVLDPRSSKTDDWRP